MHHNAHMRHSKAQDNVIPVWFVNIPTNTQPCHVVDQIHMHAGHNSFFPHRRQCVRLHAWFEG